jgi:hypothetical protein
MAWGLAVVLAGMLLTGGVVLLANGIMLDESGVQVGLLPP